MTRKSYRSIPLPELVRMWEAGRNAVVLGAGDSDLTIGDLLDMRREIDRRRGESNPTVEVDFEKYVKD